MAKRRTAPAPVAADDRLPVDLLLTDDLTPSERARRLEARREWFTARGLERDWNARQRLEREARLAAGLPDRDATDPRARLYAAASQPGSRAKGASA